MKKWKQLFAQMVFSAVTIVGLPAAAQQSQAASQELPSSIKSTEDYKTELSGLPDSPSATASKLQDQSPPPANNQQTNSQPQSSAQPAQSHPENIPASTQPQAQPAQAPTSPQKAVGTAVAEAPVVSGVAASQPAGVAIAPAKQRRVRTIVLRVGAIVGVGVAVGSVVALTEATSSKPPGAR